MSQIEGDRQMEDKFFSESVRSHFTAAKMFNQDSHFKHASA